MRTIIRYSLDKDTSNPLLGPQLDQILLKYNFTKVGTRLWEADVNALVIRRTLREFWNTVHQFTGPATLDHFWMYADNPY